jgi:hypothetical protein
MMLNNVHRMEFGQIQTIMGISQLSMNRKITETGIVRQFDFVNRFIA